MKYAEQSIFPRSWSDSHRDECVLEQVERESRKSLEERCLHSFRMSAERSSDGIERHALLVQLPGSLGFEGLERQWAQSNSPLFQVLCNRVAVNAVPVGKHVDRANVVVVVGNHLVNLGRESRRFVPPTGRGGRGSRTSKSAISP